MSNNNKNSLWLILLLLLGLIGVSIYAFKQKQSFTDLSGVHEQLKKEFNDQVAEIEKLKTDNSSLNNQLADKIAEIERLKKKIIPMVNKKQISPQEIIELTKRVAELTKEVDGYKARIAELEQQVAQLKDTNAVLTGKNVELEQKKVELEQTINQASQIKAISLTASFIKKVWFFGYTEKPTENPEKVFRATISFYLQNNFLSQNGTKDIYISIVQPNGQVLVDKDLKSGEVTIDGQTIKYTEKMVVNYDKTKSNEVTTAFEPDALPMQNGQYEVIIYDETGAIISDRSNFFFSLSKDAKQ